MNNEPRPSTFVETNESSSEMLAETDQYLDQEAVGLTVPIDTAEAPDDKKVEKRTSEETVSLIDDYKVEHGSVQGLSMKEMVERGFDPDTTLLKLGNERLEEGLQTVNNLYRAERDSPQWKEMEKREARSIRMTDEEIDALLEAGANPQHIVDALQRVEPEDGVDNSSSARIAARLDRLVDAGLPPAIVAARLNPSWREASKDKLAEAEARWREANRLKAVA